MLKKDSGRAPEGDALTKTERVADDEGPFPETIVQIRLDGTSRAYIRADGPELQEIVDRAVADERAACAAEADAAALESPRNRCADSPRAAYRSGACRAAWRIRTRGAKSG